MNAPLYYTKKGLAQICGISVRCLEEHTKAGTLRLDKAKERIPGLGVRFKAGLAERFIAAMRARHGRGIEKPEPNGRTVTIQLTEADAERLVAALQALTAALLVAVKKPGE